MGIISSKPKQNLIINGNMRIAQRGTSFVAIASAAYSVDRWQYGKSGSMVHTVSQSSDGPTDTQSGYQFLNSLDATVTTAQGSIGVNDENFLRQSIEGYNFTSIARQKPFTISFWVKATVTGTYCIALRNSGNDRSYIAEYSVSSSNTWEYKTVTISTPTPPSGTWDYTNGIGLQVLFVMAAGTNRQTTAGSWQTGNFIASSNQVNAVATNGNIFRITGVMLNEGSAAPAFKTFGASIDEELVACQRYYEKSFNITDVPVTNSGISSGAHSFPNLSPSTSQEVAPVTFKATKRATPTVTMLNPSAANNQIRSIGGTPGDWSSTIAVPGQTGFALGGQSNATASGATCKVHWVAEAEL